MNVRDTVSRYALFVLASACPLALCAIGRPIVPTTLPALRLPRAETEAAVSADVRAAAAAPRTPAAQQLQRLFHEHGQAEVRALESPGDRTGRLHKLHATYERLVKESGLDAALALRSRAVQDLEAALSLTLPAAQLDGVMGIFANALAAYHATRDGDPLTSHFVIRTLYKARWNKAMSLDSAFAFSTIEQRAFHGFLALHADNRSNDERVRELASYAAAGGTDAFEARGVLAFREREYDRAEDAFVRAQREQPSLRLRNHLLAVRVAAAFVAPGTRAPNAQ